MVPKCAEARKIVGVYEIEVRYCTTPREKKHMAALILLRNIEIGDMKSYYIRPEIIIDPAILRGLQVPFKISYASGSFSVKVIFS